MSQHIIRSLFGQTVNNLHTPKSLVVKLFSTNNTTTISNSNNNNNVSSGQKVSTRPDPPRRPPPPLSHSRHHQPHHYNTDSGLDTSSSLLQKPTTSSTAKSSSCACQVCRKSAKLGAKLRRAHELRHHANIPLLVAKSFRPSATNTSVNRGVFFFYRIFGCNSEICSKKAHISKRF